MTGTEIIEGTAVELVPEVRAVAVVQQPGQSLVAQANDPEAMVAVASRLATVLKDIVDRQHLYADIKGKRYPTVEAWMTIARLDNVVAREPVPPIRHEDGSYEAFAEIVRLSDGMVIGASSALCGTKGDDPWSGRAEPARRSMAQTRATSRAFRQQYSWIMALAGYEPTPAEEMPHSHDGAPPPSSAPGGPRLVTPPPLPGPAEEPYRADEDGPWDGDATTGSAPVDGALRETADGAVFGFVVMEHIEGRMTPRKLQVIAKGDLAHALDFAWRTGKPDTATVYGDLWMIPWSKDGQRKPPYRRVEATRVLTPDWVVPAPDAPVRERTATATEKVEDLSELPW